MGKSKKKIKSALEIRDLYNEMVIVESKWRSAVHENIKAIGSVRIKDDEEEGSGLLIRGVDDSVMRIDSIWHNPQTDVLEMHVISIEGKVIDSITFIPLNHLDLDTRDYVYENIIWPL